ncbi:golgin_subfamily B member 1-like [Hexamita inflata]|uniref:Golgin subfamily B member 1-like n=1 Tax=Hexamita inflata TaxID=28002 RepID=A0AA86UN46_9EUKA|nr:golgin subfamily B member 1-like [Hexamita inflata]
MDVGIAAAQSTATAAAATGAANSGLISTLQSQVVKLEGENAMLTSDITEMKAEQTTIKVDAAKVATDLKKFEIGQGITDAGLQGQITKLQTEKADKETTYTKLEVDAYFVAQTDTNTNVSNNLLQLGSSKANNTDVYTITEIDNKLILKADKTYVDTGFNIYGNQLTTLKTRADNIEILNSTQTSQITALQTKDNQFTDVINTILSVNSTQSTDITGLKTRCTNIETLNTSQSNAITSLSTDNANNKSNIASLQTDNATNKSNIATLQTDNTANKNSITVLLTDNTKQNQDILNLQTNDTNQNQVLQIHTANFLDLGDRCKAIEDVDATQQIILDIHTGNFGTINQNFTDIWGRLDTIEAVDFSNVTKRLDYLDQNVGDMMPTVDFNNKWRVNEAVPKIAALETDNTNNKTNLTSLTTRANEQDQTNLTFGGKITTLQTDNTKNKQDIFNVNTNITNINTTLTSYNTRITNLESFLFNFQTRGPGWYKIGDIVTCYGNAQIGGGGQIYANFAVAMVDVFDYIATVRRGANSGGGCDVLYVEAELTRLKITHDFATNAYVDWINWHATGRWK